MAVGWLFPPDAWYQALAKPTSSGKTIRSLTLDGGTAQVLTDNMVEVAPIISAYTSMISATSPISASANGYPHAQCSSGMFIRETP